MKIHKNRLGVEYVQDGDTLRFIADEEVLRLRGIKIYSNLKQFNINRIKQGLHTMSYTNWRMFAYENKLEMQDIDLRNVYEI